MSAGLHADAHAGAKGPGSFHKGFKCLCARIFHCERKVCELVLAPCSSAGGASQAHGVRAELDKALLGFRTVVVVVV